jgi:hypothetical protein
MGRDAAVVQSDAFKDLIVNGIAPDGRLGLAYWKAAKAASGHRLHRLHLFPGSAVRRITASSAARGGRGRIA